MIPTNKNLYFLPTLILSIFVLLSLLQYNFFTRDYYILHNTVVILFILVTISTLIAKLVSNSKKYDLWLRLVLADLLIFNMIELFNYILNIKYQLSLDLEVAIILSIIFIVAFVYVHIKKIDF